MIRFLFKGIVRDRSRSLLPVIVVAIGVALIVLLDAWIKGIMGESLVMNANFSTGHVKVMTRSYAAQEDQIPNDLALLGVDSLSQSLQREYPLLDWTSRIRFGGLIDFPDEQGETRAQGPVVGWALNLLDPSSREATRFNIAASLVDGHTIREAGEALITADMATKFQVKPGDNFTLFGSTMEGSMSFRNFKVAGLVRFGSVALDRGGIIIDISDARQAFAMEDGAGELLGFFRDGSYHDKDALQMAASFNSRNSTSASEYAPVMKAMRDQGGMAEYIDYTAAAGATMTFVFVTAMAIVLWNAGLLGGLRRYGEFGVRLALGEEKRHLYTMLLYEGILIGLIGSTIGTLIGVSAAYYLEVVGVDIGGSMKSSTLMMPSIVRADVTNTSFIIGFAPGTIAMLIGNALAGTGIYKRRTAQLFKELEV